MIYTGHLEFRQIAGLPNNVIIIRQVYKCRLSYSDRLTLNQVATQFPSRGRMDPDPVLIQFQNCGSSVSLTRDLLVGWRRSLGLLCPEQMHPTLSG